MDVFLRKALAEEKRMTQRLYDACFGDCSVCGKPINHYSYKITKDGGKVHIDCKEVS